MKTKLKQILTPILFLIGVVAFAQQSVSGTVTDESGTPIPGATVVVSGTDNSTTSDFDGNFTISASINDVLSVSYVGYVQKEAIVTSSTISISLTSSTALDEVVVTGYGTFDKKSYTGSAVVISGEELSTKNISNISKALIGEAVGVTVVNNSGQPGTSSTVRVRGKIGSINGNNSPLYVVDGFPYNGSLNAINPNDIESTTILKDAAATAIYGNRGANGVILITTKRGSAEKTNISVSVKTGTNMDYLPRYSTIESPERFTELVWESLKNRGQALIDSGSASAPASAVEYANTNIFGANGFDPGYNMWTTPGDQLIDPATGRFFPAVTRKYNPENWRDYAFQDSQRNEVNFSLSGGSEKTRYFYSVGALEDIGYSINSSFKRYSTRLNLDFTPSSKLSAKSSVGYSYSTSNANGQSSDSGSVFWTTANMPRIYPLFERDADGNTMTDIYGNNKYDYGDNWSRGFAGLTNSIADANYNTNMDLIHNLNLNQGLTYNITDDIDFESNFSLNYSMDNTDFRSDPFYGSSKGQGGYISKSKYQTTSWNLRNAVRYDNSIDGIDINAFLAHESESYEFNYMNGNKYNLVIPSGLELDNAVVNNTASSYTSKVGRESIVGFAKVAIDKKYFFGADIRRDGTSIFANEKWGTFGSLSFAWAISEEDFFNLDLFDFLKFKTSYGIIGESGGQGFYPGYDVFSVENLNGGISLAFSSKGNPDLTWEKGEQLNLGFEFETKAIDGSIEYYTKQRDDMFFTQNVGPSVGYRSIIVNDGGLKNSGIEFDLDIALVNSSNFSLDLKLIGAMEMNEITAMPIDPATGEEKLFDPSGYYGLAKGHSAYEFYMRDYAGVNPDTGYAQWFRNFDDANGNGVHDDGEEIDDLHEYKILNPSAVILEDKVEVYTDATKRFLDKDGIPDLFGSFSLDASYGNFDLSSVFTYQIGGWSYDYAYRDFMDNESAANMQQLHTDIENRWQNPGDVTDVPILNSNFQTNQASTSSRFLIESDYLNLATLQLGYTLPTELTGTLNIKSARLFVAGDNLMVLSKRDGFNPTYSLSGNSGRYTYEPMTTVSAGLTINF